MMSRGGPHNRFRQDYALPLIGIRRNVLNLGMLQNGNAEQAEPSLDFNYVTVKPPVNGQRETVKKLLIRASRLRRIWSHINPRQLAFLGSIGRTRFSQLPILTAVNNCGIRFSPLSTYFKSPYAMRSPSGNRFFQQLTSLAAKAWLKYQNHQG